MANKRFIFKKTEPCFSAFRNGHFLYSFILYSFIYTIFFIIPSTCECVDINTLLQLKENDFLGMFKLHLFFEINIRISAARLTGV